MKRTNNNRIEKRAASYIWSYLHLKHVRLCVITNNCAFYCGAWRSTWQSHRIRHPTQTRRQQLNLYFDIISSFMALKRYVSETEYSHLSSLVSVTIRLHISGVLIIMLTRLYLPKPSSTIFTQREALLHMGFNCVEHLRVTRIYNDFVGESCAFSFG